MPELESAGPPLERPYTISQITAQVKALLEESLAPCWVIGEVSKFTHHSSGHRYFTLKDEASQLGCVMFKWQGRGLSFTPEPGMKVMAFGHLSVYERGGNYQFYATRLQPAGVGELALAFEQLKSRLEAEGLFDPERKRPLPPFPQKIGIVTSPTGAAIRDIVQVLGRRAPGVQLILRPARVQGPGAAEEIARAIADLNRHSDVDILIVGRGGGSPEDLWPFNEEVVARAIYASARPVISAVGHEIDYTIADYVADYRAPTPSAAAEVVAQEHRVLRERVAQLGGRLARAARGELEDRRRRLEAHSLQQLWARLRDRLEQQGQYADERRQALAAAFDRFARSRVEALHLGALRLRAGDPLAGLGRGFAFCQRPDGQPIRTHRELEIGGRLVLRFREGKAQCRVEEISDG